MIFSIYRDSTSSTDAKKLTPVQMNQAIRNLFKESDAPNKPKTDKPQEMMDFNAEHQSTDAKICRN